MKKKLLFIALCLTVIITMIIFVERSTSKVSNSENTVKANVSLVVYKSSDYASAAYSTSSAQLHVVIQKVNLTGEDTIVWEKNFDSKYLTLYPSVQDAIRQNVEINNILKKDEYLVLEYDIIYDSQGSKLQIKNAVIVDDSSNNISISI